MIRRFNLGEADRIVTLISPDRGKLRAVARGVRKIKSRQAGHLELFCETEVMLAEGRNLDVLTSARLINHWPELTTDYERAGLAYLLAELIDRLVDEAEPSPELYEAAIAAYAALADGTAPTTVELFFKLRLLSALGYRPGLTACVVCRRPFEVAKQYWFSPHLGGIVDATCRSADAMPISIDQINLYQNLLGVGISYAKTDTSPSLAIIDRFYDHTFGKRFKSQQIFRSLT